MNKQIGIGAAVGAAAMALAIGVAIGNQAGDRTVQQPVAVSAQDGSVEMVVSGTVCTVWMRDTSVGISAGGRTLGGKDPSPAYEAKPESMYGNIPCDTTIYLPVELINR